MKESQKPPKIAFLPIQKKPFFNRGFHREILKMVIFDPPRKPPRNPHFDHFWPFLRSQILITFEFKINFNLKNPQNCHFWPKSTPPRRPPQSKNPGKWPFWRKPGFSSKIWTAKRGGVGVYPGTPQKGHFWPFLTIFGHFWPFLAIFDLFSRCPLRFPKVGRKMWAENVNAKVANFGQKRERNPPRNPPGQTDYI